MRQISAGCHKRFRQGTRNDSTYLEESFPKDSLGLALIPLDSSDETRNLLQDILVL